MKSFPAPILGAIAGLIDVLPMLVQKLPWEANLSAFLMWVIAGFFIKRTSLALPAPLKGIVIAFLLLTPTAVIIAAQEPFSLLPISLMTLVLGAGLGWAVSKTGGTSL